MKRKRLKNKKHCSKLAFSTKERAKVFIRQHKARYGTEYLRPYKCAKCKQWHTTTTKKKDL